MAQPTSELDTKNTAAVLAAGRRQTHELKSGVRLLPWSGLAEGIAPRTGGVSLLFLLFIIWLPYIASRPAYEASRSSLQVKWLLSGI